MTDDNVTEETELTEIDMLKKRADMMGIVYSNNIGLDTLKERVANAMQGIKEEPEKPVEDLVDPSLEIDKRKAKISKREFAIKESMKLIRCRINNLNPDKQDLPGEIITIGNELIGTVSKFIPFGEQTEDGYHIPQIIYDELQSRKFLNIRTKRDRNNRNQIHVEQNWAKEYAIEVLPQLTTEELNELATAQRAASNA